MAEVESKTVDNNKLVIEELNAFNESLDKLKKKIKERNLEINADTIMTILKLAMEIVEMSQLKGDMRKAIVIKLLRHIIVEAPISDNKEKLLLDMIDNGIVSNMIELGISATQGQLNVNAAEVIAYNCFTRLLKLLLDKLTKRK